MFNILSVLQELASPIKKERVGLLTLFCTETSPLTVSPDEAKINCSKDSFVEFIDKIGKSVKNGKFEKA